LIDPVQTLLAQLHVEIEHDFGHDEFEFHVGQAVFVSSQRESVLSPVKICTNCGAKGYWEGGVYIEDLLFANAIARTEGKGLHARSLVVGVIGFAEPALRDEGFWISEIGFVSICSVLTDCDGGLLREACVSVWETIRAGVREERLRTMPGRAS
jgi:hypothetical protein